MLLRTFSLVVFGMSINAATAYETFDNTTVAYLQGQQSQPMNERIRKRRRGIDCHSTPPPDATVWTLNICEYARFCYADPQEVLLWLPDHKLPATGMARVVIEESGSLKTQATGRWGRGKTWAWPVGVPIQSGTVYSITIRKGPQDLFRNQKFVLHRMPSHFSSDFEKVDWIYKNCSQPQVNKLLNEQQI